MKNKLSLIILAGFLVAIECVLIWHWLATDEFCKVRSSFEAAWFPNGEPNTIVISVRGRDGHPIKDAVVIISTSSGSSTRQTNDGGVVSVLIDDNSLLGIQVNDYVLINKRSVLAAKPILHGLDVYVREL